MLIVVQLPFVTGHRGGGAGRDDNAYFAVPFTCWLINLVVAEWLIRRRSLPSFRLVTAA